MRRFSVDNILGNVFILSLAAMNILPELQDPNALTYGADKAWFAAAKTATHEHRYDDAEGWLECIHDPSRIKGFPKVKRQADEGCAEELRAFQRPLSWPVAGPAQSKLAPGS